MDLRHRPIPGYWYSSPEGLLYCIRAFLYHNGSPARIWMEDISGVRASFTLSEWRDLDLVIHSPMTNKTVDSATTG